MYSLWSELTSIWYPQVFLAMKIESPPLVSSHRQGKQNARRHTCRSQHSKKEHLQDRRYEETPSLPRPSASHRRPQTALTPFSHISVGRSTICCVVIQRGKERTFRCNLPHMTRRSWAIPHGSKHLVPGRRHQPWIEELWLPGRVDAHNFNAISRTEISHTWLIYPIGLGPPLSSNRLLWEI